MSPFNSEIDFALRQFIAAPDNFLDGLRFVNSLHSIPVLAARDPYAVALEGQKVIPVFTSKADLDNFKRQHPSAKKQDWIERSSIDLLGEAVENQLHGLVFNIKKEGDFTNSTIFKSSELVQLINIYTKVLRLVHNDDNKALPAEQRRHYVPVLILEVEKGNPQRSYPTMSFDGQTYIPVFTSIPSFSKWYNDGELGFPFRVAKGMVMAWTMDEMSHPAQGESGVADTAGIVIDPMTDQEQRINWQD